MNGSAPGNRGAAILIAVAAALVVMLAVGVLFALMDRMITGQLQRESEAQIRLSEASALDAMIRIVETGGPPEPGTAHRFNLGGVVTTLTAGVLERTDLRRGGFTTGGDATPLVVPSGRFLFAVTPENGVTVGVFSGSTTERLGSYRLGRTPLLTLASPIRWQGGDAVLLALDNGAGQEIFVVSPSGVQHSLTTVIDGLCRSSVITSGGAEGSELLAVSNGGNRGFVVNLRSGLSTELISPPGTCPAITPSGEVFGRAAAAGSLTLAPPVTDVFFEDVNRDGRLDMVWAGPRTLYALTSRGLLSGSPSPGASLLAWGMIEGSLGLGARWSMPGGQTLWTRLTLDGFSPYEPVGALTIPWTGRFFGRGTVVAGTVPGGVMLSSVSGSYSQQILEGNHFVWGDADGGDVDVFAPLSGGIEAVFNPLAGDGFSQHFDMQSSLNALNTRSSHRLLIFDDFPRRRVFSERERPVKQ
jgi:hypothetical protein